MTWFPIATAYAVILLLLWLFLDERKQRLAASDKWALILNQISENYSKDLEKTVRMITRTPDNGPVQDAIYIPREPDAEEVAARAVSEHTVKTGMSKLREMYRDKGLTRTDDELRQEVEAIAAGRTPSAWQ